MIKSTAFVLLLTTSIAWGQGTYIASNAKIVNVTNTAGNADEFIVYVQGGTGPCTGPNPTIIKFKKSSAGSPEIFNRAFTLAITALMSGKNVSIHNYVDDACDNAVYIGISSN